MARPAKGALGTLRLVLWLMVALVAGLALYAFTRGGGEGAEPSDGANYAASIGGPFTLTAADGSTVTDTSLKGQPYAIFFGFTRCPDVCPTSLSRLAQLRKRMGDDGDRFRIVFVSVDAGRDTPQDVGSYVELFKTPIMGLTGTKEQIDAMTKSYGVFYKKVPVDGGDYTVDHTTAVFLMDGNGQLQSIIDYHENADASLAKLKRLVEA